MEPGAVVEWIFVAGLAVCVLVPAGLLVGACFVSLIEWNDERKRKNRS